MSVPTPRSHAVDGGDWTSKSSKGAAHELLACVHLMRQGFHVYRAESPHAPFDLVAYRDGAMVRVEVKTSGPYSGATREHFPWPKHDEWDLLLIVTSSGAPIVELRDHDPATARQAFCAALGVDYVVNVAGRGWVRMPAARAGA